jgi:hypothetical protein
MSCIAALRDIAVIPKVSDLLALMIAQPENDGHFSPECASIAKSLARSRKVVLLCFPPKAAGTFLRAALIKVVDGQLIRAVHAQGGRDAQPYLPLFAAYYAGLICDKVMVAHMHMQAFTANRSFIEQFGLRPIVMLRSIPDMLASYADMICSGPYDKDVGINVLVPERFRTLSREDKAEFLLSMVAPWYVSFYATWREYTNVSPHRVLIITYPELKKNPEVLVYKMARHSRFPCTEPECKAAVEAVWAMRSELRFNKGVSGRGAEFFTSGQIARLSGLIDGYPELADWMDILLPS